MGEPEAKSEAEPVWNIRRVLVSAAPPRAAHYVSWTRLGGQILLEVGYFDLVVLEKIFAAARDGESSERATVDWLVTDRFIFDFDGADRLVHAAKALEAELDKFRRETDSGTA